MINAQLRDRITAPAMVVAVVALLLGLGATTSTADTKIWIATGNSAERRYLGVRVNHATGLTWVEDFQSTLPSGL